MVVEVVGEATTVGGEEVVEGVDGEAEEATDITEEEEVSINTLRPRQNGRHFADDLFKCI